MYVGLVFMMIRYEVGEVWSILKTVMFKVGDRIVQKKMRAGIGAIEIVVIIAILVAIAGIAWYVFQGQASTSQSDSETSSSSISVSPTPTVEKAGTFTGVAPKTGSGSVSLVKKVDGSYVVQLEDDFIVQEGPALFVGFANDGQVVESTLFTELNSFTGKQEYAVPASIDPTQYSQVMIWCKEFQTAFSVATLQ